MHICNGSDGLLAPPVPSLPACMVTDLSHRDHTRRTDGIQGERTRRGRQSAAWPAQADGRLARNSEGMGWEEESGEVGDAQEVA